MIARKRVSSKAGVGLVAGVNPGFEPKKSEVAEPDIL